MSNAYAPDGIDSSFFCTSEGCRYPGDHHRVPVGATCVNCGRVNGFIRAMIAKVNRLTKLGMSRLEAEEAVADWYDQRARLVPFCYVEEDVQETGHVRHR